MYVLFWFMCVITAKSMRCAARSLFTFLVRRFSMSTHRELGYKTEQDHIRDCQLIEQRKRKQMLRIEEERTRLQQHQQDLLAKGDDEGLENAER